MRSLYSLMIILFLLAVSGINAQIANSSSVDRSLTLLRGRWEYHTYDNKWKLEFKSDRRLLMNDSTVKYSLAAGAIRIERDNEAIEYPFAMRNDSLTLEYPGGKTLTYIHSNPGTEEMAVDGKFYAPIDSLHRNFMKFENALFYSLDSKTDDGTLRSGSLEGIYRVQCNYIYLCPDDGSVDTAEIRYDFNGDVNGIAYHRRLYDKEYQCILYAPPPPAFNPYPVQFFPPTPAPDNGSTDQESKKRKRDDGLIRDDKSKDDRIPHDKPPGKRSL